METWATLILLNGSEAAALGTRMPDTSRRDADLLDGVDPNMAVDEADENNLQ